MVELDRVWRQAGADLAISTEDGEVDPYLFEHAVRVATSASMIRALEVVHPNDPDEVAVLAAALYHDSGWAVRFANGEAPREEILVRPPTDSHRELGASLMERNLAGVIPAESLRRAAEAIRTMDKKDAATIEGQIVSDADNLDDFGPLALWPAIRRGVLDGKGVQAIVDTWRRRKEYQFWSARLNDSFFFDKVRKLAEARLSDHERTMQALEQHHTAADLQKAIGAPILAQSGSTVRR
jgi:hypothetical protein